MCWNSSFPHSPLWEGSELTCAIIWTKFTCCVPLLWPLSTVPPTFRDLRCARLHLKALDIIVMSQTCTLFPCQATTELHQCYAGNVSLDVEVWRSSTWCLEGPEAKSTLTYADVLMLCCSTVTNTEPPSTQGSDLGISFWWGLGHSRYHRLWWSEMMVGVLGSFPGMSWRLSTSDS